MTPHQTKPPNPRMTATARNLRQPSPLPERLLWKALRSKRLNGWKFRRQHAIEPYVVDFYCHEAQLVVELDGDSHIGSLEADEQRPRWLERQGLRVIRFTNTDVLRDRGEVAAAILRELTRRSSSRPPSPSPALWEGS